jgi:hypothetical protein
LAPVFHDAIVTRRGVRNQRLCSSPHIARTWSRSVKPTRSLPGVRPWLGRFEERLRFLPDSFAAVAPAASYLWTVRRSGSRRALGGRDESAWRRANTNIQRSGFCALRSHGSHSPTSSIGKALVRPRLTSISDPKSRQKMVEPSRTTFLSGKQGVRKWTDGGRG